MQFTYMQSTVALQPFSAYLTFLLCFLWFDAAIDPCQKDDCPLQAGTGAAVKTAPL
jgi:hypothetical protein